MVAHSLPTSKTNRVDESRAVVAPDTRDRPDVDEAGSTPQTPLAISSASDSEDSEDSEDEEFQETSEKNAGEAAGTAVELLNGHLKQKWREDGEDRNGEDADFAAAGADHEDVEGVTDEREAGEDELEEPSFGDMLRARHPEQIDVVASFPQPHQDRQALIAASGDRTLSVPSANSLGIVLTQALKTNDKDLLESVFRTANTPDVRATTERLSSPHAAVLLQRLAERIHKRPGRTGKLMAWVHWTVVAHGAYLATQPELMKKLSSLSQVIRDAVVLRHSRAHAFSHLLPALPSLYQRIVHRSSIGLDDTTSAGVQSSRDRSPK